MRDHFPDVRDGRMARACVLAGGILWRLAVNMLGVDAAIDAALDGPTLDRSRPVFSTRHSNQDRSSSSTEWWDDSLTEEEANLICGVYNIIKE